MAIRQFMKEFAINPVSTGAIAPSSSYLAKEMVSGLDLPEGPTILEYGPGTGAFTSYVLQLHPSKFLAIENNPRFQRALSRKFPHINVHRGSVADVRAVCDRYQIGEVDCIVSGLPWAAFSEPTQKRYLDAMMSVLKSGGRFVTFAYSHGLWLSGGRRFATKLPEYFSQVEKSRTVWLNLPPAFVYRCRR